MKYSLALLFILLCPRLGAQHIDTAAWVPNGAVHAALRKGNNLYIGGKFDDVGPFTGSYARLDSTGTLRPGFPRINGRVNVILTDTFGRCYIGGSFTRVNDHAISNLVRLDAAGAVDITFAPDPTGEVFALALRDTDKERIYIGGDSIQYDGILYIGGSFTAIGDSARINAAAFYVTGSGVHLSPWKPDPDNTVYALEHDTGWVFMGGDFTSAGGQLRTRLAKVDDVMGIAYPSSSPFYWNLAPTGTVRALAVIGDTLVIGGDFTSIGTSTPVARLHLAITSKNKSIISPWNLAVNDNVHSIYTEGDTIYFGGLFNFAGSVLRNRAAATTVSSATVLAWNPDVNGLVRAIAKKDSLLYLGGDFTMAGGQPRKKIACVSMQGNVLPWDAHASGTVRTIRTAMNNVLAGGDFITMNGVERYNIAQIDLTTGKATFWNPGTDNTVLCFDTLGSTLYAGGNFTTAGNQPRDRIAAIDLTSGGVTSWNPGINGTVRTIKIYDNKLYAGGLFSSAGTLTRNNAAAISLSSGIATPWDPNVNGTVNDILPVNGTIYIGGYFSNVFFTPQNYLAALDTSAINPLLPWNPNPDAGIYSLAYHAGSNAVLAGGWFTNMDGESRKNLAKIDASSGAVASWMLNTGSVVRSVWIDGDTLYAGGDFTIAGGEPRDGLVRGSALDATISPWTANCNNTVNMVKVSGDITVIGGGFTEVHNIMHPHLAIIRHSAPVGIPVEQPAPPRTFAVHPNPFNSIVHLDLPAGSSVKLTNLLGQQLLCLRVNANSIDLGELMPGIYIITAEAGGRTFCAKVVKQ